MLELFSKVRISSKYVASSPASRLNVRVTFDTSEPVVKKAYIFWK